MGWVREREVTQEKEKYIEIEGYCMTLPAFFYFFIFFF